MTVTPTGNLIPPTDAPSGVLVAVVAVLGAPWLQMRCGGPAHFPAGSSESASV